VWSMFLFIYYSKFSAEAHHGHHIAWLWMCVIFYLWVNLKHKVYRKNPCTLEASQNEIQNIILEIMEGKLGVTELFIMSLQNVCWCWITPLSAFVVVWDKCTGFTDNIFQVWGNWDCVVVVNFLIRQKPNTIRAFLLKMGQGGRNNAINLEINILVAHHSALWL
jgi:hypothetical protein